MWVVTCDPGIDDAVALAVAAGLTGFGPAAVVGGAGNVPAGTAWRNAVGIAALLGLDVPVGLGDERALDGRPITRGPSSHGGDGLGGLAYRLPAHRGAPPDAEPLVRGDVVATGPLTEVARALRAGNPVERVVWMGGSTPLADGLDPVGAEFNAAADPLAVDEVAASTAELAVVPIEVTAQVTFAVGDIAPWRTGPPVAQLCADLVDRRVAGGSGAGPTCLHDPVAVLAAAEPDLFRWADERIRCRPDGTLVPDPRGGAARIAIAVDAVAVRRAVISVVAGEDRR